ncbi:TMEM165/GDT1 family protein [Streptomyces sp. NPDC001340]
MLDFTVLAITFGVIVPAELPDKTALAALVLGARYRASYVFAGVAAAFAVHVTLAIAVGSMLTLLPHRVLQAVSGTLFLAGAALLFKNRNPEDTARDQEDEDREPGTEVPDGQAFWRIAGLGFMLVLVAEFGDLTQIMTVNLAARYDSPLSVGLGALLGLWTVAALAVLGGRTLIRFVPLNLITRIAAVAMLVLAASGWYEAVTG